MLRSRQELGAAELNGLIYAAGGLDASARPTNTVERFDPTTGIWSFVASMPGTLHHFGMAAAQGKLYVVGGYVSSFTGTSAVREYDPSANAWRTVASLPRRRGALAAVAIDGKIYAVGGVDPSRGVVSDLTVYDPGNDEWSTLAPMIFAREHLAATAMGGKLYAAGGRVGFGSELRSTEVYDPVTNRWTRLPDMNVAHGGTGAASLRGKVLVVGGEGPGGNVRQVDEYDPARGTWRLVTDTRTPVHGIYPVTLGDEIVVAGGATTPGFEAIRTVQSFRYLPDGVEAYAPSVPEGSGPIFLGVTERPVVGTSGFGFVSSNAPPQRLGALALGMEPDLVGTMILGVPIHVSLTGSTVVVSITSDMSGTFHLPVIGPLSASLRGQTFYAQTVWINDPLTPSPLALSSSDAVEITVR
jgi:N-acetylneuraminic acid mutarotase